MKLSNAVCCIISGIMAGMSIGFFIRDCQLEKRAVETKKAYYDSITAELTWSCNVTKYIITGEK